MRAPPMVGAIHPFLPGISHPKDGDNLWAAPDGVGGKGKRPYC